MSASPPSDTDPVVLALPPRWQRALPPAAALVARHGVNQSDLAHLLAGSGINAAWISS